MKTPMRTNIDSRTAGNQDKPRSGKAPGRKGETMNEYLDRIKSAQHDYTLDEIVEQAAYDDSLTNEEYCTIYQAWLDRYHELVD